MGEKEPNKKWTDIERTELQKKLDKEFDDFVSGLEKRQQSEAWPEDRWEEEMEKHPFFMTQVNENEALPPLVDGLCQLKYSSTDNTPEELATNYKEDGNFNYKCKSYRKAIISYTEGIKQKCSDKTINAQLYNNRAASHFFLKNYRSCINDCRIALQHLSHYPKASFRLSQAAFELGDYDQCINELDYLLIDDPKNQQYIDLKRKAMSKKKSLERDERKEYLKSKKKELEHKALMNAINERGLNLAKTGVFDLENKIMSQALDSCVHLDKDQRLIWPVVLLYPEYKTSDVIQKFHEDITFEDQLNEIFSEPPEWDTENKYKIGNINVYFENDLKVQQVNIKDTLGEVLKKGYILESFTPSFFVMAGDSKQNVEFIKNCRNKKE